MEKKRGVLLRTAGQIRAGALASGAGFLLYLGASVLAWNGAADLLAVVFGVISVYVLVSAAEGRRREPEAVSCNLVWGQAALTLLLAGCAVLTVKLRLGL